MSSFDVTGSSANMRSQQGGKSIMCTILTALIPRQVQGPTSANEAECFFQKKLPKASSSMQMFHRNQPDGDRGWRTHRAEPHFGYRGKQRAHGRLHDIRKGHAQMTTETGTTARHILRYRARSGHLCMCAWILGSNPASARAEGNGGGAVPY